MADRKQQDTLDRLKAELQPQAVRDPRDDSLFKTEGGSNYLSAERYKEVSGVSTTGSADTWGPPVHHGEGFAGTGAPAGTLGSVGQHPQDARESLWAREGGSNYLSAERDAALRGVSDEQLWGTRVHEGTKKE